MSELKGERIIILNDFFRLQKKNEKKEKKRVRSISYPKQKKAKLMHLALFICIFFSKCIYPYVFEQKNKVNNVSSDSKPCVFQLPSSVHFKLLETPWKASYSTLVPKKPIFI